MPSTCTRIFHLPVNILIQIFHHAALPHGPLHLDDTLLINIARSSNLLSSFFYFTSVWRILDCAHYSHYREGEETIKARGVLSQTCRLARKAVWTVWKEAVESIVVDEEKADLYESLGLYLPELIDARMILARNMEMIM